MYREMTIGLVIPARNEEKLIRPTLESVPELVDRVFVVDDGSTDNQEREAARCAEKDSRITYLKHERSYGPGAAIITGYRRASEEGCSIVVVVGGDHQMDLGEVERFLDPIVDGRADYVKGNRFVLSQLEDTLSKMPKIRLLGNWIITGLTKVASGFYKAVDVVEGYTAISKEAIDTINWGRAWGGYGYPMDFLVRVNGYGFRCVEVPRTAIYIPAERQSQIKGLRYALKVTPMLIRSFFWRLKFKYLYRDFHPLILFYSFGLTLTILGISFGFYLILDKILFSGEAVTASRAVLVAMLVVSGMQLVLFAMFFDMEASRRDERSSL